jgi:hypothetical protein
MDLFQELSGLLQALEERRVPYALCGGFALSVYGIVRATEDLDLMVPPEALPDLRQTLKELGFTRENPPMELAGGKVVITRFLRFVQSSEEAVMVDALHVTPGVRAAWDSRTRVVTGLGSISVVSREGLIALKRLRNSAIDQTDIARLEEGT